MTESNIESYPPLFRPYQNSTQKPDPKDEQLEIAGSLDPLPLIDMQCLDVQKLDKACREWGIFRLVNHGVPTILLKELHDQANKIFDLPFEIKQGLVSSTISSCPINYFWGTPALTPAGATLHKATAADNMDWMEGFNVPLAQVHHHHQFIHYHPLFNDFRMLLAVYRGHLTRIALTIFEAVTGSLKLDSQDGRTYLDESTGLVRVYRYPRHITSEHVKGLHVHTDSSVLSILSENEVGGLQFLKDDQWLDVNPIPGTLVVNLGDMMQALSDDEYKSVKHKVELNKNQERLSICYFVFPEENTLIYSSKYKPFTYNDFRAQVQKDVRTLGRKIGLQSFKLPHVTS